MHTATLKKLALALTFWLALHTASLKAQLVGPYGTSPITFEVDANGLLSATGTFGTGSLSLSGAGTRMFWYPGKAAFRAGGLDSYSSTDWNNSNIGNYSVAFGFDTYASGVGSTALGYHTSASGYASTASGWYSSATKWASTAMGNSSASGYASTAFGSASASGDYSTASGMWPTQAISRGSTAMGYNVQAIGEGSVAMGYNVQAIGEGSVAMGYQTTASGGYSTALGKFTMASYWGATALGSCTTASGYASTASGYHATASGAYASASGVYTQAHAFNSSAVGAFNLNLSETGATPNPTSWVATDPLFEIGNGGNGGYYGGNPAKTTPSDAFVVYKNGDATVQGVTTSNGGFMTTSASVSTTDIPMYSGD